MRVNRLSLPHPVLGLGDDVGGIYNVTLGKKLERHMVSITVNHQLSNKTMEALLNEEKVEFCVEINCPQTFYRNTWSTNEFKQIIEIESDKLRRKTDVNCYILASQDIPDYVIEDANEDYQGATFKIEKGDVLGYGGSARFFSAKEWEIKNIYALIEIQEAPEKERGVFRVDLSSDEKITVYLPKQDYHLFQELTGSRCFEEFLHCSVAVPTLIYTLDQMMKQSEELNTDSKWYQVLEDRRDNDENLEDKWSSENILEIAQLLLSIPLERAMIKMRKSIETELDY